MPASLYPYPPASSLSLGSLDLMMEPTNTSVHGQSSPPSNGDSRAEQLALQLALLQGGLDHSTSGGSGNGGGHHGGFTSSSSNDLGCSSMLNGTPGITGSLEDLKTQRRSQNMTECVPVPSSEHVAEIVGRQGCKIKALRAKTNTYIKTPVRGEEPVFVVTGRKEDVTLAKREILSAADHFSQIRASRKSNINSTLAFGQLVANTPGQTTVQVRVPYRVVGLVVGPKGATIKRIQQQTHTYIVTPSRDKEPVFEVTGLPENVEAARKEIEAHIALRTGTGPSNEGLSATNSVDKAFDFGGYNLNDLNGGDNDNVFGGGGSGFNSAFSSSTSHLDHLGNSRSGNGKFNSIHNNDSSTFNNLSSSTSSNGGKNNGQGITLQNLLDSNNFDITTRASSYHPPGSNTLASAWSSNGTDSHDSGIGNSPPFESGLGLASGGPSNVQVNIGATVTGHHQPSESSSSCLNGIWGELNKVLGGLDLNASSSSGIAAHNKEINKQFLSVGSRSSLDLGTLGRPLTTGLSDFSSTTANNALHHHHHHHQVTGRQHSLPSTGSSSDTTSPPSSLPFNKAGSAENLDQPSSTPKAATTTTNDHEEVTTGSSPPSNKMADAFSATTSNPLASENETTKPISCAGDFLTFAKNN